MEACWFSCSDHEWSDIEHIQVWCSGVVDFKGGALVLLVPGPQILADMVCRYGGTREFVQF